MKVGDKVRVTGGAFRGEVGKIIRPPEGFKDLGWDAVVQLRRGSYHAMGFGFRELELLDE